jgi:hypothetical protein
MGIVERIKGLFGGGQVGEVPEAGTTAGEEELDIEAVQRDLDQDRAQAYERLSDVDGRSD